MESPSPKSGKRGLTGKHGNHRRGRRVPPVVIACEVCGVTREYQPSQLRVRKRIRFCSRACMGVAKVRPDSHVATACNRCGRAFTKRRDHLTALNYCSRACSRLARRADTVKWPDKKRKCGGIGVVCRAGDKAAQREYMRRYLEKNLERHNELSREWSKANRLKKTAASQRYRAVLKGAAVGEVDFTKIAARDGMRCHICRLKVTPATLSYDHVIPLSKGGDHSEANIAVSHRRCNSRKNNKITRLF